MRILATGCTQLQIGDVRVGAINKIDVPMSIVKALRAAGHDVDWRKVEPGEDLSMYDMAWLFMAPINSLNGRAGAMGMLWTAQSGLPCAVFCDDWQIGAMWNGVRAVTKQPEQLTKYLIVDDKMGSRGDECPTHWSRASVEAARDRIYARNPNARIRVDRYYMLDTDEGVLPYAKQLIHAASEFDTVRWSRGMVMVCPMYAWGDHSLINKRFPKEMSPFEVLDPSSTIYGLIAEHEPLPPEQKRREWVMGSLASHELWVNDRKWDWPLNYVGSRINVRRNGGKRFKTESEVIAEYNNYWGIVSPPYPQSGSGWWRSRFIYAARVRSVLCCDKNEAGILGKPYRWGFEQVEKLEQDDLQQLADEQAAALRPFMPAPDEFIQRCHDITLRAYREDEGGAPRHPL